MEMKLIKEGTALTAKPEGRIDTVTAPDFQARVAAELEGMQSLVVDMKEVEYISSACLRALLFLKQNFEGGIVIRNVSEVIAEVFEVTGFDDFMTIE